MSNNSTLKILNPLEHKGWDDLILSNEDCSFFHTTAWTKTICESYNYSPICFAHLSDNHLLTLIPLMEINSILTGKRGVSLPFTDYCEPIIDGSIPFGDVFNRVITYGKKKAWKHIELRGGKSFLPDATPSTQFFSDILDLKQNEEQIFPSFRNSAKRNIKKACYENVKVDFFNSPESIREYYRLHCITRKRQGVPPQPFYFFKEILDHIISRNLGFVALGSYLNKNIAGAVFFHYGNRVYYKYGASDTTYQHLRANNLIMWEAIKWSCRNGYKSFCFGRTDPKNKGLRQYKAGWNTKETIIKYYKYDLRKDAFVKDTPIIKPIYNKILKKVPLPILKTIGALLYKHIG
jgi:hypothetical protein